MLLCKLWTRGIRTWAVVPHLWEKLREGNWCWQSIHLLIHPSLQLSQLEVCTLNGAEWKVLVVYTALERKILSPPLYWAAGRTYYRKIKPFTWVDTTKGKCEVLESLTKFGLFLDPVIKHLLSFHKIGNSVCWHAVHLWTCLHPRMPFTCL